MFTLMPVSRDPLLSPDDVRILLERAEDRLPVLGLWEREFIQSIRHRYDKWHDKLSLSPKQQLTLKRIAQ